MYEYSGLGPSIKNILPFCCKGAREYLIVYDLHIYIEMTQTCRRTWTQFSYLPLYGGAPGLKLLFISTHPLHTDRRQVRPAVVYTLPQINQLFPPYLPVFTRGSVHLFFKFSNCDLVRALPNLNSNKKGYISNIPCDFCLFRC